MRNLILKKATVSAVAFVFSAPLLAQTKPFAPKISTPSTQEELVNKPAAKPEVHPAPKKVNTPSESAHDEAVAEERSSAAPSERRIHTHSLGAGLGQNFLLGDYSKYGDNKITMDVLYTYAASYSFDLLVDAHWSEQQHDGKRLQTRALTGSIKSRLFEFDNFSPFVLGGLGFYAPRARRYVGGQRKWTDQKLTFGLNFGGGVDLRLNEQWTVGAMGQLHWPFAVKQDNQSDLKGYYFKLLLTLGYTF